eukprot:CAMPEP_0113859448 /NCGR_PEP_ID=MMETSP0372-20130328/12366_1 /TAXON_ID=340204 /ORGANISM="Lankesteria abbotti" /LENGTH=65 /DNA_ID=CAMNT_0000837699 /DNA_START=86 /DNA_END=283 /DNA_ORIENTATION=- /assembly_acc=CAM_ASM_000359
MVTNGAADDDVQISAPRDSTVGQLWPNLRVVQGSAPKQHQHADSTEASESQQPMHFSSKRCQVPQ